MNLILHPLKHGAVTYVAIELSFHMKDEMKDETKDAIFKIFT